MTPEVRAASNRRLKCPTGCENPAFEMTDDVGILCQNCGAVVSENTQLVSEQTFAEGPSGQIHAQGVAIGAGETHRRGGGFANTGKAGSEATPTRKTAENNAKMVINRLCDQLNIRTGENEQALRLFNVAYAKGFVRGRSLDDVALISLYTTIRQSTEQIQGVKRPRYGVMLIDFAEKGDIDVFALGKIFTDFVRDIFLEDAAKHKSSEELRQAQLLAPGPEVFVSRFVDELEFPPHDAPRIKSDAYKIIASMKRDWITRGRRPAGICGAAVIIAARMNNYRRTVREVVLVAKVTEITLNKRLEEFSETPLSKSSVDGFKKLVLPNVDYEDLQEARVNGEPAKGDTNIEEFMAKVHEQQAKQRGNQDYSDLPNALDPPIMRPKKKKRGRPRKAVSAAELENDGSEGVDTPGESDEQSEQRPVKQARVDAEGFAIPTQPASSSTPGKGAPSKKGPGRTKGSKNWRAPAATAAERAIEQEIQDGIDESMPELEESATRLVANEARAASEQPTTEMDQASAAAVIDPKLAGNSGDVDMSAVIGDDEFEDDEDVATCLLNDEEKLLKEKVWVNENADWLRQDHAKRIRRNLKEQELKDKGIDPVQFERNKKAQGRRRKDGSRMPHRAGDTRYLHDPDFDRRTGPHATPGAGDRASVASSRAGSASPAPHRNRPLDATESVTRMLRQRTPFSTRLNYSAIGSIYGNPSETTTRSPTPMSPSRASSVLSDARSDLSRARSTSILGSASRNPRNTDEVARTATEKRFRIVAGLPADTDRSDIIFGGYGGKNTGLQRSKGSLSAEKRQKKVYQDRRASGSDSGSPSVGRAGRSGSQGTDGGEGSAVGTPDYEERDVSVSASPSPGPSRGQSQVAKPITARPVQQPRNVTFAKSPTSAQDPPSGGNTPRSGTSSNIEAFGGTEEVVEGEAVDEDEGLIMEVAPPGAYDDDDIDDEEDDYDEDDDEGGEPDIDGAFAGNY
jgi:transcription factor IIIB 90 kDa subunit